MLGFDPSRDLSALTAKAYFLPDLLAAAHGQTRWRVVRNAVLRLAAMSSPIHGESVRSQLHEIDEEINRHPEDVEEDARYLAIDLVTPQKVRVKIYIRVPGHTFGDVWNFFTLGFLPRPY